jgi:hypothetical protein
MFNVLLPLTKASQAEADTGAAELTISSETTAAVDNKVDNFLYIFDEILRCSRKNPWN